MNYECLIKQSFPVCRARLRASKVGKEGKEKWKSGKEGKKEWCVQVGVQSRNDAQEPARGTRDKRPLLKIANKGPLSETVDERSLPVIGDKRWPKTADRRVSPVAENKKWRETVDKRLLPAIRNKKRLAPAIKDNEEQ